MDSKRRPYSKLNELTKLVLLKTKRLQTLHQSDSFSLQNISLVEIDQAKVIEKLPLLSAEDLLVVKTQLQLPDIPEGKKTKSFILKMILKYLSGDEVENSEDGGISHFL